MNKDIQQYIANCTPCHTEKAKVQSYPLQMTEIPDRPFDKIAIDSVTECKTSGSKHILTIIDHLTGWLKAFPIPDKSADTILLTFINHYLPVHMCPWYILLDNGTEFKNQLMDQVLKQHGIDYIFSAPITLRAMENWNYFTSTWKLHLRSPVKRSHQLGQIHKPSTHQLLNNTKSCYGRDAFLSSLWTRLKPAPTPTSGTNAVFLGNLESGRLNLETHWLTLAIVKKTLDEKSF